MKKIFLPIIFLFLLSSFILAQPPAPQFNTNGLQIFFVNFDYLKFNSSMSFPFHVTRISDGMTINDSTTCYLHIYNSSGNHIYINSTSVAAHGSDYEFNVSGDTFDYIGNYGLTIRCMCVGCSLTNADLGGTVRKEFAVTNDGLEKNFQGTGFLAIIILIPLIFGLFMLIGAASLGQDHNILRIFLFLLSVPMIWISLHWGLIGVINYYNLDALQNSIGTTTYWIGWLFFVLLSYFIIYLIIKIFDNLAKKREEKLKY